MDFQIDWNPLKETSTKSDTSWEGAKHCSMFSMSCLFILVKFPSYNLLNEEEIEVKRFRIHQHLVKLIINGFQTNWQQATKKKRNIIFIPFVLGFWRKLIQTLVGRDYLNLEVSPVNFKMEQKKENVW